MEQPYEIAGFYLAFLRSLSLNHQVRHWRARGPNFYGNHLMFERIYKTAVEDADLAAEKFVGLFGTDAVEPGSQAKLIGKILEQFSDGDPIQTSLKMEKEFIALSEKVFKILEEEKMMSLGLNDMLSAIASNRESAVYLLKQASFESSKSKNEKMAERAAILKSLIKK